MALNVRVSAQTKKATADINRFSNQSGRNIKQLERTTVSSGRSMIGVFTRLTGLIATLGLARGFKESIMQASSLQEAMNLTEKTFLDFSDSVIEASQKTAGALGIAQADFLKTAGLIGSLQRSFGETGEAAGRFSLIASQLSADIASFRDATGGADEVLRAFLSGVTGETEPLKRFATDVRQSRLEAIALRQGLGSIKGESGRTARSLAVLLAVIEDNEIAMGDFTDTQGSFQNQFRSLKADFKDFLSGQGAGFLGFATDSIIATRLLIRNFDDVGEAIVNALTPDFSDSQLVQNITQPFEKMAENIQFFFKDVFDIDLAENIDNTVDAVVDPVKDGFTEFFDEIISEWQRLRGELLSQTPLVDVKEEAQNLVEEFKKGKEEVNQIQQGWTNIGTQFAVLEESSLPSMGEALVKQIQDAERETRRLEGRLDSSAESLGAMVRRGRDFDAVIQAIAAQLVLTFGSGPFGSFFGGFLGAFHEGGGVRARVGGGRTGEQLFAFSAEQGEDVDLRVSRPNQTSNTTFDSSNTTIVLDGTSSVSDAEEFARLFNEAKRRKLLN